MLLRTATIMMTAVLGCSAQRSPDAVPGPVVNAPAVPARTDVDAPASKAVVLGVFAERMCIVGTADPRCELDGRRIALDSAIVAAIPDLSGVCTLRDDGVVACGLGPEDATVVALGGPARALVSGGRYTCALLEVGSVSCWSRLAATMASPSALGVPDGVARVAVVAVGMQGVVVVDDLGHAHYGSLSGASIGEPDYAAISIDVWTPLLTEVERAWVQGAYGCVLTRGGEAHCFDTAGGAIRTDALDGARALALLPRVGACAVLADGTRCFEPEPVLGKPIAVDPATAYVPGPAWPTAIVAVTSDGRRMCAAGPHGTVACTSNAPR